MVVRWEKVALRVVRSLLRGKVERWAPTTAISMLSVVMGSGMVVMVELVDGLVGVGEGLDVVVWNVSWGVEAFMSCNFSKLWNSRMDQGRCR